MARLVVFVADVLLQTLRTGRWCISKMPSKRRGQIQQYPPASITRIFGFDFIVKARSGIRISCTAEALIIGRPAGGLVPKVPQSSDVFVGAWFVSFLFAKLKFAAQVVVDCRV